MAPFCVCFALSHAVSAGWRGQTRVIPCHGADSSSCTHQFGNADEIVSDQIEQKVGRDPGDPAMLGFAHCAVLLAPAEDTLDHRAPRPGDAVAGMTGGAASIVLRRRLPVLVSASLHVTCG